MDTIPSAAGPMIAQQEDEQSVEYESPTSILRRSQLPIGFDDHVTSPEASDRTALNQLMSNTFVVLKQYVQNRVSIIPNLDYGQHFNTWIEDLKEQSIDACQLLGYVKDQIQAFADSLKSLPSNHPIHPGGMELTDRMFPAQTDDGINEFGDGNNFVDEPTLETYDEPKQTIKKTRRSTRVERKCRACWTKFTPAHEKNFICDRDTCQARMCHNCDEERVIYTKSNGFCKACTTADKLAAQKVKEEIVD